MHHGLFALLGAAAMLGMTAANAEVVPQKVSALTRPAAAKSNVAKPTTAAAAKKNVAHGPPVESGLASIYCFRNGVTASGERVRPALLAAAHKSLPFNTLVEVTNRDNGRSIVVRIIDRGPFVAGRIIDLTPAAARALKFDGLTPVTVRVLDYRRDQRIVARAN